MRIDSYIINNIDALEVTDDFEVGDDAGTSRRPRLPALSIPVAKKTNFEFPDAHQTVLCDGPLPFRRLAECRERCRSASSLFGTFARGRSLPKRPVR